MLAYAGEARPSRCAALLFSWSRWYDDRSLAFGCRLITSSPCPLSPNVPLASTVMAAAAALPSFIELMATLGLDGTPNLTSPASMSSAFDLPAGSPPRELDVDKRHSPARRRTARYSPYISVGVRRSAAVLSVRPFVRLTICSQTLTRPSSVADDRDRRRVSHTRLLSFGASADIAQSTSPPPRRTPSPELSASPPISSYMRRKTPSQRSPTASTFSQRPVQRPEKIALPTLIPIIVQH